MLLFLRDINIFWNFKHFKWAERPLRIVLWPWKVGVRIDTTGYTNFKSAISSSTLFIILSISKKVILTWFSSAIVVSSFNLQPNTIMKLRAKLNQAGNVRDIQQRSRCRITARGHDRFVSFNYLKSTRLEHTCLYCYLTLITLSILWSLVADYWQNILFHLFRIHWFARDPGPCLMTVPMMISLPIYKRDWRFAVWPGKLTSSIRYLNFLTTYII